MIAETKKKVSALRIGIFTVFMVVTVIVMLKSVVSITPILFVKLGQVEAGAIDFMIKPSLTKHLTDGNTNWYAVNPFEFEMTNNITNYTSIPPAGSIGLKASFGGYGISNYEDHVEVDIANVSIPMLKTNYFQNCLKDLEGFGGFAPRLLWPHIMVEANNKTSTNVLMVINSTLEVNIGLGPEFPPYIIGRDEIMLNTGIIEYLGIEIGENVTNSFDFALPQNMAAFQLMGMLAGKTPEQQDPLTSLLAQSATVKLNWIVGDTYEQSAGKFPAAYGNVVLTDCTYLFDMLIKGGFEAIKPFRFTKPAEYILAYAFLTQIQNYLDASGETMCDFAMMIDGILDNQASYYMDSYENISKVILEKATVIQNAIKIESNSTISEPLMKQFKKVTLIQDFLNSVLTQVIVFLAILSGQLLYSLMLSDVDQKTYEYGMLRALGFKEGHLMTLISIQSFIFSVPGVLCGICTALILNMVFRGLIYLVSNNASGFWLTSTSIVVGVLFGLLMPLLAIYYPVQSALSKNLRNSLDLNHRQNQEISVTAQKLEDIGLSLNQTIVGVMLLVLGFITYYCVPLTFFYHKMQWFFFIFDLLLLLIILGMTFISILIFEYVERLLLWIMMQSCCRRDRRLEILISKNLDGHRNRNSKTSIMFTLALSFLIFAASSFSLISTMIASEAETIFGADLFIYSSSSSVMLDQGPLDSFLQSQLEYDGSVETWSFTSCSLQTFFSKAMSKEFTLELGDLSGYYETKDASIYSVPSYYLEVINPDFYFLNSIQSDVQTPKTPNGEKNAIYLLYSNEGLNPYPSNSTDYYNLTSVSPATSREGQTNFTQEIQVVLPTGLSPLLSENAGDMAQFCLKTNISSCEYKYRVKIRAFITKLPGFLFSGFKQIVAVNPQIVISEDQYAQIMQDFFLTHPTSVEKWANYTANYTWTNGVPKQTLLVNLAKNCTESRRQYVINGIRALLDSELILVVDKVALLESVVTVNKSFSLLVGVIGFIALCLTFFLLMVATTSNIRDNIWEYGVLRSMGVTKAEGSRIYMYEAFVVILAAGMIGLLVGIISACLVTAQFYLFLELPFALQFPTWLTVMLCTTALITTYFAVVVPITAVNKKEIAVVLKSGS